MLPRAIALDFETIPLPAALEAAAAEPPDFKPADPAKLTALLVKELPGVGATTAPQWVAAWDGPESFYEVLATDNGPDLLHGAAQAEGLFTSKRIKVTPDTLGDLKRKIESAEDDWWSGLVKDCSVDPLRAKVASVAFWGDDGGAVATLADYDGDERVLLAAMWKYLRGYFGSHPPVIVTFNGWGFDRRVAYYASMRHGLRPPWLGLLTQPKHARRPICDLYQILTDGERNRAPGGKGANGLDAWCRRFGIHAPKGADGQLMASEVYQASLDERWEEIGEYNLADVRDRTWPLFCRIRQEVFPQGR